MFQYAEASRAIQTWLIPQKLQHGGKLPSARLLAKEIGFSKEATERACIGLIASGILFRTGYKLVVGKATSPKFSQKGIVYILSYLDVFTRKAEQILSDRGIEYSSVKLNFITHKSPIPTLQKVFEKKPAGVILWMPTWIDGFEKNLESVKIPIVICTDGAPINVQLNLCGTDLYRGTELAIQHLHDLGHSKIALILKNNEQSVNRVISDNFRKICLGLDLKHSASNIWELKFNTQSKRQKNLMEHRKRHPEVTALICSGPEISDLPIQIYRVPEELSVVGLYTSSMENRKFLTTVEIHPSDHRNVLWACTEMISLIQNVASGLPEKLPRQTFLMPTLMIRESTKSIEHQYQGPMKKEAGLENLINKSPWESWWKTYSSLQKSDHHWKQLDLAPLANHSMTQEHGWLGAAPLLHFSSGLRQIHGVPFEVIQEKRNHGRSVVTFQSPHTHSTGKNKLPVSVQCQVKGCVNALYFLHGCGWVEDNEPFAQYIIHFKTKQTVKIPLIPLGLLPSSTSKRQASLNPNIQDWWSEFKPQDFPHAMYATIFDPANPQEYQRTLYTLEWINPRPKEEISHIEIQVDPKAGPALALIAITARL